MSNFPTPPVNYRLVAIDEEVSNNPDILVWYSDEHGWCNWSFQSVDKSTKNGPPWFAIPHVIGPLKAPPEGYRLIASGEAVENHLDILVSYTHSPEWRSWSFKSVSAREAEMQGLKDYPWFAIPNSVEEFTLVIWSNVHEELEPALIMLDDEAVQELGTTHEEMRGMEGVYINCSEDEDAATRLNAIVYDEEGNNRLSKWKLNTAPQMMGPMTIVRCGFVS